MPEEFELQPPPVPGEVPQQVIDELCECRRRATDFAEAFSDAIKAQAEKYDVERSALRKYVCAIEDDAVEKLANEVDDLARFVAHEQSEARGP